MYGPSDASQSHKDGRRMVGSGACLDGILWLLAIGEMTQRTGESDNVHSHHDTLKLKNLTGCTFSACCAVFSSDLTMEDTGNDNLSQRFPSLGLEPPFNLRIGGPGSAKSFWMGFDPLNGHGKQMFENSRVK